MATRKRESDIPKDERREWLRQHEEMGRSLAAIAKDSKHDRRTVKRQVEAEAQDRERREAKSLVLRKAMEDHYKDLCKLAGKIDESLIGLSRGDVEADPLWKALHEHLDRAALWKNYERWKKLGEDLRDIERNIHDKAKAMVQQSPFGYIEVPGHEGFGPGLVMVIIDETEAAGRGNRGWDLDKGLIDGPLSEGIRRLELGGKAIGYTPADRVEEAKALVRTMMSKAKKWKEIDERRQLLAQKERSRSELHEDLLLITLKRVVPGKCRYCP